MSGNIPKSPPSMGTEKRAQIIPSTEPEDTGFILPNYDFAAQIPIPTDKSKGPGVTRGGSISDVYNAARGVMYYNDVIGYGQSGSYFTRNLPFQPYGINFFMKSGLTCSNGAEMWKYFEGIPKGDSLGKTLQNSMAQLGVPGLKGLAPGILEDSQAALDIRPVLNAAFGSVYPVCEKVTLPVGDYNGKLVDDNTKDVWVNGEVEYKTINGVRKPTQTRWVQKMDERGKPVFLNRAQFYAEKKTQNLDGSDKVEEQVKEGFEVNRIQKENTILALVFLSLGFAVYRMANN